MADKIDKALPNVVKETVHVESPEEIEIEETQKLQEINDEGVEVTRNEDGSADIDFEPGKVNPSGGEDHFENLADYFLRKLLIDSLLSFIKTTKIIKIQEKTGNKLILKGWIF